MNFSTTSSTANRAVNFDELNDKSDNAENVEFVNPNFEIPQVPFILDIRTCDYDSFSHSSLRTGLVENIYLSHHSFFHPTPYLLMVLEKVTDSSETMVMYDDLSVQPIQNAELYINGKLLVTYDFIEMTEWNWLKCGASVPSNMRSFLIPFSREAFDPELPCTVNFSRCDSVTLKLILDPKIKGKKLDEWSLRVSSKSKNIFRTMSGLGGNAYSN